MTVDYVYCGICGKTTRHILREKSRDMECSMCGRKKITTGKFPRIGEGDAGNGKSKGGNGESRLRFSVIGADNEE